VFDVVIITPGYLCSNPRTVKEADALTAGGLRVRVVCAQGPGQWARDFDREILDGKRWDARAFRWSSKRAREWLGYWRSTVRFYAFNRLAVGPSARLPGLAERAECRVFPELAALARRIPARLYIGHYPGGLAAAAAAARTHRALLGYDIEDLHTGEDFPTSAGERRRRRLATIERRYLPRCTHVSAVSDGVADAVAARHAIARPLVVHNVFPLVPAVFDTEAGARPHVPPVKLAWFSQVIGLDRGIQDAIQALGLVAGDFELHLRGSTDPAAAEGLRRLADDVGIGGRIHFHPWAAPTELLGWLADQDIGLALEQPTCANKLMTVSNKVFSYLAAGLAVVATDTPGQHRVVAAQPGTGSLYPPGDYHALARILEPLIQDPLRLQAAKDEARRAARERWNWPRESERLVQAVGRALGRA
jgi:glycosyltransferase involved in cell wall biosynthesis